MDSFDVVIIGGGIVGTCLARELSRFQVSTCLLEKEEEVGFGVSKANSGIVHAGFHEPPSTLKGRLCAAGNRGWGDLQNELAIPFKRVGEIVAVKHESEFATLEELIRIGEANGVPGLRRLNRDEIHDLEPNLADTIIGGLLAPTAGVINPYESLYLLAYNAVRNGVVIRTGEEVLAIRAGVVQTTRGKVRARFIVNAAGLYADRVARMAGLDDVTIRPRRGQEYLLDKKCAEIVRRIIFPLPTKTTKGTLIIPTLDGTVMIGPSAEDIDDRDDCRTTGAVRAAIVEYVRGMVPALDPRRQISSFAGNRPVAAGEDFLIGPTRVPGFFLVAGIQSPGLTAAPAIAVLVRDQLAAAGLELRPRVDFVPGTPLVHKIRDCSFEQLERLIEVNPDYGSVICRCERVSEAEIRQAVRQGARTLDGVKFRTRAGMGRCQGGFCSLRVMEILAEERGIPLARVTKKGPGSTMLPARIGRPGDD